MQWIDVQAKRERNLGLKHKNRKGNVIPAKEMKNPCKEGCRNKCREKISEQRRKEVFEEFWKIGDHTRQWDYIARCVKAIDKKQIKKKGESRRNFSRKYNIILKNNEILVCKTMFLNTFGISEQWVITALDKILKTGFVEEDKRGKHNTRVNKINNEIINSIKQHIELFPVIPSHYTRKTSTKMYLEEGLNISIMHRLYLEYMQRNNFTQTTTLRQYRDIFNTQYNIGFFKPKKDQCNICAVYAAATPEDKSKMQEKYEKHKVDKEAARSLKDLDKEAAKNDKSVCASCFHLQKVLATPQSAVSQFYYKSKLATYNFTIYDVGNNEGYCYVWNEIIAKRGPNEISSAILHFLKTQKDKGVTKVILYSDNCGGQNRNRFIFSMFCYASMSLNLEIIHRFLELRHTQNEGDSMHSVIEHAKKHQPAIYTPDQWVMLIRMAKVSGRPYIVKEMSQNDFFSFKEKVKLENWKKDRRKKIKNKSNKRASFLPNEIKFKYGYNEEFKSIQLKVCKRRNIKTSNMDYQKNLPLLYSSSLAIDCKKLKGLLELCKTNALPKMYHNYYYSLLPKEEKEKKKKGKSFTREIMESVSDNNNEYEDYLSIIESN
ncbi:uncharacterized protein [Onthophagus taurus]|uniref:uncharacterized protein n=1 Tax=Onthophagus taurus TaxID=166361 RepID=UPI0039BEC92B